MYSTVMRKQSISWCCLRTRFQGHGTQLAYDFITLYIEDMHQAYMNRYA